MKCLCLCTSYHIKPDSYLVFFQDQSFFSELWNALGLCKCCLNSCTCYIGHSLVRKAICFQFYYLLHFTHTYTLMYTYLYTYPCMRRHTLIHTCTHTCIHTLIHKHKSTDMHTIYTVHTHIYTQIPLRILQQVVFCNTTICYFWIRSSKPKYVVDAKSLQGTSRNVFFLSSNR